MNYTPDKEQATGNAVSSPELEEYRTRLGLLYDVAQQASSVKEVLELVTEITSMTQRMLGASASLLFTVDEEREEFCLRATSAGSSGGPSQIKISLDSGIVGWVARHKAPVIIGEVSQDGRYHKDVDEVPGIATRSVIAAPLVRGQRVIGVLEMINKVDGGGFSESDLGLITEFASAEALILLVSMAATLVYNIKLCQTISGDYKSGVEAMVSAADAKDPYASGHSRRVRDYTLMAAGPLGLSPDDLKYIEFGALLHDIGKIGIDDRILRKPGPLTKEEWYIIHKHTLKGANIVREIPNLEKATDIVLYHHERYDGKGYPEGLKGEKIPMGARLVAIADAFDTITTAHSYRAALSIDKAIRELNRCSGKQFCPRAVKAFVSGYRETHAVPSGRVAKELARLEAEQARQARASERLAAKQTVGIAPKAKEAKKAGHDVKSELFKGDVRLTIKSPADRRQINQFMQDLSKVKNLKVLSDSWSEREGFIIVVSLEEPVALGSVICEMPQVEGFYREKRSVVIVLKGAPDAGNSPENH